jgi:ferredoxin
MEAKILRCDRLAALIEGLLVDGEVIAPRDEFGYGPITAPKEIAWGAEHPRRSLKELFLPQREVLFTYRLNDEGVALQDVAEPVRSRTVLARPCDAAALPILDEVFSWDYVDSAYRERRRQTTVVTLACEEPGAACFCTAVGGSPAGTAGSDLLLTRLGDLYHVQVLTAKGEALVQRHVALFAESTPADDQCQAAAEAASRAKVRTVAVDGLAEQLDYDSPVWMTITEQCIDCAICTFLCPTCHCFDIQDEGNPAGGERVRLWDSCASRDFTRTAAHQPRPTHASRYRQRILHKFKYYPENFGRTLCVGCGRCTQHCPAGIDLATVLERVRR